MHIYYNQWIEKKWLLKIFCLLRHLKETLYVWNFNLSNNVHDHLINWIYMKTKKNRLLTAKEKIENGFALSSGLRNQPPHTPTSIQYIIKLYNMSTSTLTSTSTFMSTAIATSISIWTATSTMTLTSKFLGKKKKSRLPLSLGMAILSTTDCKGSNWRHMWLREKIHATCAQWLPDLPFFLSLPRNSQNNSWRILLRKIIPFLSMTPAVLKIPPAICRICISHTANGVSAGRFESYFMFYFKPRVMSV